MRNFNALIIALLMSLSLVMIGCSDDSDSPTDPANTAPEITSEPTTVAHFGQEYVYNIEVTDEDGDEITITPTVLPEWLSLSSAKEGTTTARLSGTPGTEHAGDNPVTLEVSDGIDEVEQNFVITVDLYPEDLANISTSYFDYYLGIVEQELYGEITAKTPYYVAIQALSDSDLIMSASLKINGQNVPLQGALYFFYGEIETEQGETLTYEATINGDSYSGELTIPYRPQNVTFPETFDPTDSYDITWQLTQDSQYQLFEAHGWGPSELFEVQIEALHPSERSFSIPADWIGDDWADYDLSIAQYFVQFDRKFIAIAIDGAWAYHGFDMKTHKERFARSIENIIQTIEQ